MCSCKMTPLQKVERRIQAGGFDRLAPSELVILDQFIFGKLGIQPSNMEERKDLYGRARFGR